MIDLKALQKTHEQWSLDNFGRPDEIDDLWGIASMLSTIAMTARMSHTILKGEQGIRDGGKYGELAGQVGRLSNDLVYFRDEARAMLEDKWYAGEPKTIHTLLGLFEELGELTIAVIDDDAAEIEDAVGDVVLYLLDFCASLDIDLEPTIREVAEEVHDRDWSANPETGGSEAESHD